VSKILILISLILTIITFSFNQPALAADLATGAKLFQANCAPCHSGGLNVVNASKTLQKQDLEKYKMFSKAAIKKQITVGKNAMPAFGNRLTESNIEALANYVLSQAKKGWKA
jgi:cytochrome c6